MDTQKIAMEFKHVAEPEKVAEENKQIEAEKAAAAKAARKEAEAKAEKERRESEAFAMETKKIAMEYKQQALAQAESEPVHRRVFQVPTPEKPAKEEQKQEEIPPLKKVDLNIDAKPFNLNFLTVDTNPEFPPYAAPVDAEEAPVEVLDEDAGGEGSVHVEEMSDNDSYGVTSFESPNNKAVRGEVGQEQTTSTNNAFKFDDKQPLGQIEQEEEENPRQALKAFSKSVISPQPQLSLSLQPTESESSKDVKSPRQMPRKVFWNDADGDKENA